MQTSSWNKDEEDVTEQQKTPQLHFTDPRTLNMEEYKGMGFDENNCSPIPPVNRASSHNILQDQHQCQTGR